jgi:hypothetical protein
MRLLRHDDRRKPEKVEHHDTRRIAFCPSGAAMPDAPDCTLIVGSVQQYIKNFVAISVLGITAQFA